MHGPRGVRIVVAGPHAAFSMVIVQEAPSRERQMIGVSVPLSLVGQHSCDSRHLGVFWLHLQQAGNCRGIWEGRRQRQDRLAGLTTQFSVGLHASIAGPRMRGCEVGGHLLATSEIHLVGCLPGEGCMGNYGVVLLDVECDQFSRTAKLSSGCK